jgi:hypothetical protein
MRQTVSNHARAATSPSPTPSSHIRPAAMNALPVGTTGPSCGYAYPAVGWPVPMAPPISMQEPTTKRPTTRSPFSSDRTQGHAGAMSINAPSERSIVGRVEFAQVAGYQQGRAAGPEPNRVALLAAGWFKTIGIDAARCLSYEPRVETGWPRRGCSGDERRDLCPARL